MPLKVSAGPLWGSREMSSGSDGTFENQPRARGLGAGAEDTGKDANAISAHLAGPAQRGGTQRACRGFTTRRGGAALPDSPRRTPFPWEASRELALLESRAGCGECTWPRPSPPLPAPRPLPGLSRTAWRTAGLSPVAASGRVRDARGGPCRASPSAWLPTRVTEQAECRRSHPYLSGRQSEPKGHRTPARTPQVGACLPADFGQTH